MDGEIDSGDFRTVEKTVATNVGPTSVAVVALLEEDDDADFINSVDDDDFVDSKRIWLTSFDGALPLLHMDGDGAYYRVRFVTSS